ncbi:tRNA-dihydrouridine synthase [Pseudenhygromyxa sp. WMMC2535]|uniref:tRNA dihydrouridine synthase n=1 Tax=Pseudenhygromyxa sp. WMMC2535 TaxID=2712867 RepID=UPI00155742D0|nr:tRNA-dihydrouridine synthase [Pseudenhygromyxa sp. WMMC2535]NVB37431.1 tRNA-dihydrouridine synthase [Pseudenhygromyxa sp. WMMC2535]
MSAGADTNPAGPQPLRIGPLRLWPPVVLAPMAGVTDPPFRTLCRRFAAAGLGTPAPETVPGLFVSEMITARPLVEGNPKTQRLAAFAPGEHPRSLQLYGVDPSTVGQAVARLVGEGAIDHLDMNFGCPVPKVTRRGGGAAIPAKPRLLARIVAAAVKAAGEVPVTIKFRKGIDDSLITFRDAGRVAQEEGCAAVGLHARTALEFYEDGADWRAIAELVDLLDIPVLGNGDIWEWPDALRMMAQTGCAGVIVGRGCLGRPWLFRELAQACAGRIIEAPPRFGEVAEIMLEHAAAMTEWAARGRERERDDSDELDSGSAGSASPDSGSAGSDPSASAPRRPRGRPRRSHRRTDAPPSPEALALRAFRKHASWYTKGFRGSTALREQLMQVDSLAELEALLAGCDADEPFPDQALRAVRGKRGRQAKVVLPAGYRDQLDDDTPPGIEAEQLSSGG